MGDDALLLDLDDTLLATRTSLLRAREQAIRVAWPDLSHDFAAMHDALDAWLRCTWYFPSGDLRQILPVLGLELGLPTPSAYRIKGAQNVFSAVQVDDAHLISGADAALREWTAAGGRLAVITNGDPALQWAKIRRSGLSEFLDESLVFVSDPRSPEAKPAPTMFIRAAHRMGIDIRSCTAVGDRPTDIIAGSLSGAWTILFLSKSLEVRMPHPSGVLAIEKPSAVISRWDDLSRTVRLLQTG